MGLDDDELASAAPGRSRREVLVAAGAELLPSLIAAAIAGFLVAGVGGRLAMFLLRVTSGDDVVGLESDDGFIIGRVTTATIGLVLALTVAATIAVGPAYTVARLWIPPRWRSPVFALLLGIFGGGLLVHADGIDFTVLSPKILAVALFIAIPFLFGALLEPLHGLAVSRLPRLPDWALLTVGVLALVSLFVATPLGLAIGVISLGLILVGQGDRMLAVLRSQAVTWLGRLGLVAIAGLSGLEIASDIDGLF